MFPIQSARAVAGWTLRGVLAAGLLLGSALPRSASAGDQVVQAMGGAGHSAVIAGGVVEVRGSGENVEIVYGAGHSAVIAGGVAEVHGSGENLEIVYGAEHGTVVAGGVAEVRGGGEDVEIVYNTDHDAAVGTDGDNAALAAKEVTAPAQVLR